MPPDNTITPGTTGGQSTSPPATNPPPVEADTSSIITPAGVGIRIDNVNQSLWQYVKQRKLIELILLAPFVAVWEAFLVILFIKFLHQSSGSNSNSGKGFGYLMAIPIIVFFSWLYRIKKQFEDAFLEEFALTNGYTYDKNGTVDETYGTIFRLKGDQHVSDVLTGTYNGIAMRLFICELTIGSGNQSRKYEDTVIELDLHGQLPNLLMVNKKSQYGRLNLASSFGIKNTFTLEGDFNQYFTIYGQPNNQIEALEVFSPDTMALMEDESKHYTVEFSGNRIYIYANGFIGTTQDITQAFALAKKLIDKIAPLASRLQNDSAIIATPVNIIQNRKSHPFARKLFLTITILFAVSGLSFMVFALLTSKSSTLTGNARPPTSTEISSAISVSHKFMQDLGKSNILGAEQLESPHLQQDANLSRYLASGNWQVFGTSKIIKQNYGVDDSGAWVGVIYEDDSGNKPYYIKLALYKYGQDWRIWYFQTSYNSLNF